MAKTKRPPQRYEVSVEVDGKAYTGSYYVESKMVTLECLYGTTSTQIGDSGAELVARMLLREFLDGAKARGVL